jgi:SfnB family sulfur acquisition oxidoreductase
MTFVAPADLRPQVEPLKVSAIRSDHQALSAALDYAKSVRPGASERDASRRRPFAEIRQLRESGLLTIAVPREFGGPEVQIRTLVDVFRIISAADPAIGQIPQNHFSHLENIRVLGTLEQKRFFYREILDGAMFGNALSERGTAGGQRNLRTRLHRRSDGWILEGRKFYSTGALFAQWLPVTALDEDGRAHVAHVPCDAPGVEVVDDWDSMGQRGTASGTTILSQVVVPDEHVVPVWRRDERPSTRLSFGQIMHVAVDIGIAEEALADTVDFIRTRSRAWHAGNFDRAGDDPHTIRRIGELTVQLEAARALLWHAADTFDAILLDPLTSEATLRLALLVASAKAAASAICVQISNDLFALAGTSSADEKWNLHRHWRNARTHTLHDPEVWKYHYIGDYVLNGREPPRQALII